MDNNDYEKAKQECWREWLSEVQDLNLNSEQIALIKNAFEFGFHSAWHIRERNNQLANGLVNERLQAAAMAMQGLLGNGLWMSLKIQYAKEHSNGDEQKATEILKKEISEDAVEIADALLTELNKPKNETDKED